MSIPFRFRCQDGAFRGLCLERWREWEKKTRKRSQARSTFPPLRLGSLAKSEKKNLLASNRFSLKTLSLSLSLSRSLSLSPGAAKRATPVQAAERATVAMVFFEVWRKEEVKDEREEEEKKERSEASTVEFFFLSLVRSLFSRNKKYKTSTSSFYFSPRPPEASTGRSLPLQNHKNKIHKTRKKERKKETRGAKKSPVTAAAPYHPFAQGEERARGEGRAGPHCGPDDDLAPMRLGDGRGVCRGPVLGEDAFGSVFCGKRF